MVNTCVMATSYINGFVDNKTILKKFVLLSMCRVDMLDNPGGFKCSSYLLF